MHFERIFINQKNRLFGKVSKSVEFSTLFKTKPPNSQSVQKKLVALNEYLGDFMHFETIFF